MTLGFAGLALGLFAWLLLINLRSRRFFDRPAIARGRLFDPALALAGGVSILSGLALLWSASPLLGAVAAGLILLAAAYRQFIRSVPFQRWLLRRDYRTLRRRYPDLPESAVLFRLVMRRHPSWGEELVEQIVLDYPTLDELGRVIARMRRGFRGFR